MFLLVGGVDSASLCYRRPLQWHSNGVDRVGKVQGAPSSRQTFVYMGETFDRFADFGL